MLYKPNSISPHSVSVDASCVIFSMVVEGRVCTGAQLQIYTGTSDTWDGWENLGDRVTGINKLEGDEILIAVIPSGGSFSSSVYSEDDMDAIIEADVFQNGGKYKWRADLYETTTEVGSVYSKIGDLYFNTLTLTTSSGNVGFSDSYKILRFQLRNKTEYSSSLQTMWAQKSAYMNFTFLSAYSDLASYYVGTSDAPIKINTARSVALSGSLNDLTPSAITSFTSDTLNCRISTSTSMKSGYYEAARSSDGTAIRYALPVYIKGTVQPDIYIAYGGMGLPNENENGTYGFSGSELTIQYSSLVRDGMRIYFPDSPSLGYLPFTVKSKNIQDSTMVITLTNGAIAVTGDESSASYKIYSDFISTYEYYFTCEKAPSLALAFDDADNTTTTLDGTLYYNLAGKTPLSSARLFLSSADTYIVKAEITVTEDTNGYVCIKDTVFSSSPVFTLDGLVFGQPYTVTASVLDSLDRTCSCEMKVVKSASTDVTAFVSSSDEDSGAITIQTNVGKKSNYGSGYVLSSRMYRLRSAFPYLYTLVENRVEKGSVTDYAVGNREDVKYLRVDSFESDDNVIFDYKWLSAATSTAKFSEWDAYYLYGLTDNGDNDCTVSGEWCFSLAAEEGSTSHAFGLDAKEALAPMPKIERGETDYLSGSLSCELGYISCDGIWYDDAETLQRWRKFCAEHDKFLYKDLKGNVYIVAISQNSWQNETAIVHNMDGTAAYPTKISFSWTEIAHTDDYSIHG